MKINFAYVTTNNDHKIKINFNCKRKENSWNLRVACNHGFAKKYKTSFKLEAHISYALATAYRSINSEQEMEIESKIEAGL